MKILGFLPAWLKSKYFLTGALFIVWITFFDDRDLITNVKRSQELRDLEKSRAHYAKLIEETKTELNQLKQDPATLEKYAREKYRMKKENEDLFIIPE